MDNDDEDDYDDDYDDNDNDTAAEKYRALSGI